MTVKSDVTAQSDMTAESGVTTVAEAEHDPFADSGLDSLTAYSKLAGLIGPFLDHHRVVLGDCVSACSLAFVRR